MSQGQIITGYYVNLSGDVAPTPAIVLRTDGTLPTLFRLLVPGPNDYEVADPAPYDPANPQPNTWSLKP